MPIKAVLLAEVVETGRNCHDQIGPAFRQVAEFIFDNATNLDAGQGMFHPHSDAGQFAVAALLARL